MGADESMVKVKCRGLKIGAVGPASRVKGQGSRVTGLTTQLQFEFEYEFEFELQFEFEYEFEFEFEFEF